MQWEKLERSYQALETLLRTLQPQDRFNLILFNSQIQVFQPTPVAADSSAVQHALEFVRASRLRGGTDLQKALQEGLRESAAGGSNPYIVLLSDGGSTEGLIRNAKLASWYDAQWKSLPVTGRPKTYIFGVGDDANLPLFKLLARQDGVLENVLSTEPIDFKLNSFLSKIGRSPIGQLALSLPITRRGIRRIAGSMGWALPETCARRYLHCAGPARWRTVERFCKSQPATRIDRAFAVAETLGAGTRRRAARED